MGPSGASGNLGYGNTIGSYNPLSGGGPFQYQGAGNTVGSYNPLAGYDPSALQRLLSPSSQAIDPNDFMGPAGGGPMIRYVPPPFMQGGQPYKML